jgi:hypothetical protein
MTPAHRSESELIGKRSLDLNRHDMREQLLDCYLNLSISKVLSEWLLELGLASTGTTEEKLMRLRQQSLVLPAEPLSRQTIFYLSQYDRSILAEMCEELGLGCDGPRETLLKRIYCEIGRREGWLPSNADAEWLLLQESLPIMKGFGSEVVDGTEQLDEIAELLGVRDVDRRCSPAYGSAFVVVLLPDLLQEAHAALFEEELKKRQAV